MTLYLCYDLKGIQRYIFAVPKLRSIVGGSALVDTFDRQDAPEIAARHQGVSKLGCGGGKGAFRCPDKASARALRADLIGKAHGYGMDIAFGIDEQSSARLPPATMVRRSLH